MTSKDIGALYDEGMKKINAAKDSAKENYMLVEIGYSNLFILKYSEGLKLIEALKNAESLVEEYQKSPRIEGVDRSRFTPKILSHHEYTQIKLASLMGVTLEEVKKAEKVSREEKERAGKELWDTSKPWE